LNGKSSKWPHSQVAFAHLQC